MTQCTQNARYPLSQYRYARLYGYGDNHILRPDDALETEALNHYGTYYDYLKDLHIRLCPIHERPELQPDSSPFTGKIHNDWLMMIDNDIYCNLSAYTAESYITDVALETQDVSPVFTNALQKELQNECWAVIVNTPKEHDHELEIVFSGAKALQRIQMKNFMECVRQIETEASTLDAITARKVKEFTG